jgi:type II secretory pathway pseudopilin PulG
MADRTSRPRRRAAFTLVEVLASLLMMAIIIPVAIEGMSVASRVGMLGQRKAAAMRVAERVINEVLVESQIQQASSSGTAYEGDTAYPWVMRTENWPEDAMQQMTVTVSFPVQGALHEISVSTLLPNTSAAAGATPGTQQ